jgi:hypothetical protein
LVKEIKKLCRTRTDDDASNNGGLDDDERTGDPDDSDIMRSTRLAQ